jgi:hypothetical protein
MYFLYSRCVVLFSEIPYLHFLNPVLHKFLHHTFFYLNLVYFCDIKIFLKKFKFFIFFFTLNNFFVFLDHFNVLMLKIIFKK